MSTVSLQSTDLDTHNKVGAKAHATDNGMVAGMLDLAYIGVYGLWYEDLGNAYHLKRHG